jgi:hypothetical protein
MDLVAAENDAVVVEKVEDMLIWKEAVQDDCSGDFDYTE